MELNEKQMEQIGDYLQGNLKGDELSIFLQNIEGNPLLKEELRIQQAIQDGIEHRNNQALRKRFKKIADEARQPKKETKIFSLKFIRIAASSAAVLLIFFAAYTLMKTSSNTDSIYASYFEPSELTQTRAVDISVAEASVKKFYIEENYKEALPLFDEVLSINPSSNLKLAYGSTLLKCNKIEEAKIQFQSIIDANDPLYIDEAIWYMGLVELKNGEIESAEEYLNQLLSDSNSDYHSEAKELIKEIQSIK